MLLRSTYFRGENYTALHSVTVRRYYNYKTFIELENVNARHLKIEQAIQQLKKGTYSAQSFLLVAT